MIYVNSPSNAYQFPTKNVTSRHSTSEHGDSGTTPHLRLGRGGGRFALLAALLLLEPLLLQLPDLLLLLDASLLLLLLLPLPVLAPQLLLLRRGRRLGTAAAGASGEG